MRRDIANKWIKALRSGKFKQCRGALQRPEGHCCLGVLTEIYIHEKGMGAFDSDGYNVDVISGFAPNEDQICLSGEYLPENVRKWAGMDTEKGVFGRGYNKAPDDLANKNDRGKSFKQIANIIKKHWREL